MLRSNAAIVLLKGVTFVPLAALLYFSDYGLWLNYLASNRTGGFFVASLAMLVFGVLLKREIVETYVQASKSSVLFGGLTLVAAIAAYLFGTFYFFEPVFHFLSLLLLAASYLYFRTDARLVRLLAPLLTILGIAFSSGLIIEGLTLALGSFKELNFLTTLFPPLVVAALILGLFATYTNPWYASRSLRALISNSQPKTLIIPLMITALALAFWFSTVWPLIVIIPAPLLLLLSKEFREELTFSRTRLLFRCVRHTDSGEGDGYCLLCGTKFAEFRKTPRSGFLGLAVIVLIIVALLAAQIPLLVLNAGIPYSGNYSFSRFETAQMPGASPGWLVNSTAPLNNSQDLYVVKQIYVPAYHPETKNYTLYYELSGSIPFFVNSWGALPGWSRSTQKFSLEGFSGSLVTYQSNSSIMIVFAGTTSLNFYAGGNFEKLTCGVSIVGNFLGSNTTSSSSEFVSDLNSGFGPFLGSEEYNSGWTDFFQRVTQTFDQLVSLIVIGVSTIGIALGAYFVQDHDSKVDSLLTRSSALDEINWKLLSAILNKKLGHTTAEIASYATIQARDLQGIQATANLLEDLEAGHVVKRTYSERNAELFLTWKELM